jgi:uncharacterized damage-inducible protein DinB
MKPRKRTSRGLLLTHALHSLREQHLPRITECLKKLSEEQIWWRPHPTSNSVGNLVLHLAGNVRQWIISGLGGKPDRRERDKEFAELGPIPRKSLVRYLESTVAQACHVLSTLTPEDLARQRHIQGFRVKGFTAVIHVSEHFAYHTGQIIYVTKLLRGVDLKFTRLPGDKKKHPQKRKLSQF